MNWTATCITCPDIQFNLFVISLEAFCFAGVYINFVLFRHFFKDLKKSVFLLNLASCDMSLCFFCFLAHFFVICTMFLQSNILTEIQEFLRFQQRTINYFDCLFIHILILYIVIERFLWTCTSRTRKTWKVFTVGKYKLRLTVITILFLIGATMIFMGRLEENVIWFFQWIPEASLLLTSIFALFTLCRLTKIGKGEGPGTQEDRELAVVLGLTSPKIRRSILCMLMVYLTFVTRLAMEYTFRPASLRETIQQRNARKWKVGMLNVVFLVSRMIFYRVFCGKDEMVVEYAPNALIYF